MKKWRCKICGYIHAGETAPEICPVCGAASGEFQIIEDSLRAPTPSPVKRIIIIGNGAAGMDAARTIRENSASTEILMFSEEPHAFYSRIHLSTFIGDESDMGSITIYPESWYRQQKIEVRLGTTITNLNPRKKQVTDGKGKVHAYDKLILACGAGPSVPPIDGIKKQGVFVLRNLEHALTIRAYSRNCQSAAVVGGGILGIEAASSLARQDLRVSIFEISDRLMSRQLDDAGATVLQSILEKRGISCHCNTRVQSFGGNDKLEYLQAGSRGKIEEQLAVISAGIVPNTRLAGKAGIKLNRGIVVNEKMETSHPDIYAAGDVAEYQGNIYGIWPAAVDQGIIAASNALGMERSYNGTTPLHILKVAGIEMTAVGKKYRDENGEEEIIHLDTHNGKYVKLVHNRKVLSGAIVLGIPGIGFRLEKLIKQKKIITDLLPEFQKGNWDILKQKK